MCIATGNRTCDAMAKLRLQGNIIPKIWHKTIVSEKTGKADLIAINILADIAYWYRPAEDRDELTGAVIGYRPKFAADLLQRSYDDLADHFGISKGQAKSAIVRLEQLGVIRRIFRKISVGGILIPNVLFLELNVDRLSELTYPNDDDTSAEKTAEETVSSDRGVSKKSHTPINFSSTPLAENLQTNTKNTTKISTATSSEITPSLQRVSDGLSDSVSAERVQNDLDVHHEFSTDWAEHPRAMKMAIEKAVEWDFRQVHGFSLTKDELEHRRMTSLSLMISVLTEMCCSAKPWSYQGMAVDRTMVLERINHVLRAEHGSLSSFAEYFVDVFIEAVDTNQPANLKGYMRALLWDDLQRYLAEQGIL